MSIQNFALLGLLASTTTVDALSDVPCSDISANGLTFNCCISGDNSSTPVMLLHGFPERSSYWFPLMEYWQKSKLPIHGVACDLRGYSPKASPSAVEDYNYDTLVTDVWALADAVFGASTKFHLVGHDHGAVLGWVTASKAEAKARLLSYSALAVPHGDAFNRALFGAEADEEQQVASNYFNQFALADSATRNLDALSMVLGFGGFPVGQAKAFQKALWWYHGAEPNGAGYMARPPVLSDAIIKKYGNPSMVVGVRKAIPLPVDQGEAAKKQIGNITLPTLFVCGENDAYLLCTKPYALRTKDYVAAEYTYTKAKCGHGLFGADCASDDARQTVLSAITKHIQSHIGMVVV